MPCAGRRCLPDPDLFGAELAGVGVVLAAHKGLVDREDRLRRDCGGKVDGTLHGIDVRGDELGVAAELRHT